MAHGAAVEITIASHLGTAVTSSQQLVDSLNIEQRQGQGMIVPSSQLGVSENSVPLNPMVNDHYPY